MEILKNGILYIFENCTQFSQSKETEFSNCFFSTSSQFNWWNESIMWLLIFEEYKHFREKKCFLWFSYTYYKPNVTVFFWITYKEIIKFILNHKHKRMILFFKKEKKNSKKLSSKNKVQLRINFFACRQLIW